VNPVIIIPARLAATRLPGKPLADIAGKPMVVHVMERALAAAIGPVWVACGDTEIAGVVRAAGGHAVMTDPALPSGSDRVHAAAEAEDPARRHDVVINLQGDLPAIPPETIRAVLAPLADPGVDIATVVAPVVSAEEETADSVVKAVCAFRPGAATARALYFSRARAPFGDGPLWHHIGIYAFRRAALARFVTLPPTLLELRERLEQLRALEDGMRIDVAQAASAPFGVDTPADLERARRLLGGPAG
jgi:3-deoxy-manno-octulosonate cytidylyltransferase (CMP-KDO synthetase)